LSYAAGRRVYLRNRISDKQSNDIHTATQKHKGLFMAWKQFLTAFSVIFLAELGDKTQLAVITLSASTKQPLSIFLGGSLAMILLTGIGSIAGEMVAKIVPEDVLSKIAAVLFVVIGIWTWFKG
jgi:Ca2+/H+ antiporter, TMEM165/GDT1 family